MRGWGCNKKKVVTVLSKGNREQRLSMIPMFKTMYGKVNIDQKYFEQDFCDMNIKLDICRIDITMLFTQFC